MFARSSCSSGSGSVTFLTIRLNIKDRVLSERDERAVSDKLILLVHVGFIGMLDFLVHRLTGF